MPLVRDHPRSRGEYPFPTGDADEVAGSSPLSRGILLPGLGLFSSAGIIPALAGNTWGRVQQMNTLKDHPRSRGEYSYVTDEVRAAKGSSPLSRGIRKATRHEKLRHRIIPALAGNTRAVPQPYCKRRDHPRSRGEYVSIPRTLTVVSGSSPLSRGIHASGRHPRLHRGIIPALAGNTARTSSAMARHTDHPRSRGEYAVRCSSSGPQGGSSPLSRGIRRQVDSSAP